MQKLNLAFGAGALAFALALTGCSGAATTDAGTGQRAATESASVADFEHVHGIIQDPADGEAVLVATHHGIFSVSSAGEVAGPLGGYDFDAMGFTGSAASLFASGHPGPNTPAELGEGNLGIIRSDDAGRSWQPVAFTSVEDFHVLTAAPDGTLYGIGSSAPNLLSSTDAGENWTSAPPLAAADLAATVDGLFAATETGLQVSADFGETFVRVPDAPLLYTLDVRPDGTLVGAGTDGSLWAQQPDGAWQELAAVSGQAAGLAAIGDDTIALFDDRGLVLVTAQGSRVLSAK